MSCSFTCSWLLSSLTITSLELFSCSWSLLSVDIHLSISFLMSLADTAVASHRYISMMPECMINWCLHSSQTPTYNMTSQIKINKETNTAFSSTHQYILSITSCTAIGRRTLTSNTTYTSTAIILQTKQEYLLTNLKPVVDCYED